MQKEQLPAASKSVLAKRERISAHLLTSFGSVAALLLLAGCLQKHGGADTPCRDEYAVRDPETLRCDCGPGSHEEDGECVPDEVEEEDAGEGGEGGGDDVDVDAGTEDSGDVVATSDAGVDATTDSASIDAGDALVGDGGSAEAGSEAGDAGCAIKAWYRDCDSDGYAAAGAAPTMSCTAPEGGCGAWTLLEPAAGSADCNDQDKAYHPGAGYGYAGSGDGDLNCDRNVEREPLLRNSSATPSGNGEIATCASPSQCSCAFDLSGNKFPCSTTAQDKVRRFATKVWETSAMERCNVILPADVEPLVFSGVQLCR